MFYTADEHGPGCYADCCVLFLLKIPISRSDVNFTLLHNIYVVILRMFTGKLLQPLEKNVDNCIRWDSIDC